MSSKFGLLCPFSRRFTPSATVLSQSCRWNSTSTLIPPFYSHALDKKLKKQIHKENKLQRVQQDQMINEKGKTLERNQTRDWKAGDIYSPHDLSPSEMKKWRKKYSPSTDAFDALSINPLHQYKNFSIMSEYMTEMGRIKHSSETGLRPVNQRKIAKAIRRATGLGLMPSIHRHPEILSIAAQAKLRRGNAA